MRTFLGSFLAAILVLCAEARAATPYSIEALGQYDYNSGAYSSPVRDTVSVGVRQSAPQNRGPCTLRFSVNGASATTDVEFDYRDAVTDYASSVYSYSSFFERRGYFGDVEVAVLDAGGVLQDSKTLSFSTLPEKRYRPRGCRRTAGHASACQQRIATLNARKSLRLVKALAAMPHGPIYLDPK